MDDEHVNPDGDRTDPYGTAAPHDHHLESENSPGLGDYGAYPESDVDITGKSIDERRTDSLQQTDRPGRPDSPPKHRTERPTTPNDRDWQLDKVILIVMPEATDHLAAAMAASKLRLRTPGLNSERLPKQFQPYRFVHELSEEPASTLTNEWGDLPGIAKASGDHGEALLETAIEKTWGGSNDVVDPDCSYLYDDDGEPIEVRETLEELLTVDDQETKDEVYLVSALKLRPDRSVSIAKRESQRKRRRVRKTPNKSYMPCSRCGEETVHSFNSYDQTGFEEPTSLAEATVQPDTKGQPIWECGDCDACRYGHAPESSPR